MTTDANEVQKGIQTALNLLSNSGFVIHHQPLNPRTIYFEVEKNGKKSDFALFEKFLADVQNTKELSAALQDYIKILSQRFDNASPNSFYALSGTPFQIDIYWPVERYGNTTSTCLRVHMLDLRNKEQIAKVAPIFTYFDEDEIKLNPFRRIQLSVALIRKALDSSELKFYTESTHPLEYQMIRETQSTSPPQDDGAVQHFLANKVYWLGFMQGDKRTKTWIADPWDASYLGVSIQKLIQTAQILEAQGVLVMENDSEFASISSAWLLAASASPPSEPKSRPIGFVTD